MKQKALQEVSGLRKLMETVKPTKNMRMFLCARLFCETDVEAAQAIGIQPNTVAHYKSKEGFAEICELSQTLPIEVSLAAIQYLAPKIVVTLDRLLDDENAYVRLQAIKVAGGWLALEKKEAPRQQVAIIFEAREDVGIRPERNIHAVVVSGDSPQFPEAFQGNEVGEGDREGDICDMGGDT